MKKNFELQFYVHRFLVDKYLYESIVYKLWVRPSKLTHEKYDYLVAKVSDISWGFIPFSGEQVMMKKLRKAALKYFRKTYNKVEFEKREKEINNWIHEFTLTEDHIK